MGEDCSGCIQSKLVEKIDQRLTALEKISDAREKEIGDIKKNIAVNEEQTKMVFKILNEIKDSIKTIAEKLDKLEKIPGQNWRDMIKTIITVATTAAVMYFVSK